MIFDEVALGLRLRGVAEEDIKERVYQALKTCGLYEFRKWPISALSYGQKKRVTIASILVFWDQKFWSWTSRQQVRTSAITLKSWNF